MTLDGQLALPRVRASKTREWITSEESRTEVQRMRHASDALLTGIGTILADDPLLTDRSGLPRRRRLLRVILDSNLRLSPKARILETVKKDLLVFTGASLKSSKARRLQDAGVELILPKLVRGKMELTTVMKELGRREILSVLLEAGPKLNAAALSAGVVQKLVLFYAPKIAGKTGVPFLDGSNSDFPRLQIRSIQQFGPDVAIEALIRSL